LQLQRTAFAMTRFTKYFLTGAAAAAVDFALFFALVKLAGWPWYAAGTLSFVAATLVNYLISVRHVFKSGARFRKRDEIALTFFISAIGLGINQLILFLLIRQGAMLLAAKICATAVVFIWNYIARHRFVFREAPPASG
jgi:putative flippase GtrA